MHKVEKVRRYLKEWKNVIEYFDQHGFGGHMLDRELLCIQREVRYLYEEMDSNERAALTKNEQKKIKTILDFKASD